jgi:hypothetical protein
MRPSDDAFSGRARDNPLGRLYGEVYCLLLTVLFHDENNHGRKLLTILVVAVWAALEVGAGFGVARLPDQFIFLRVVVGVLIGRMWGIEINNFAGIEFQYSDDGDDGSGTDGGSEAGGDGRTDTDTDGGGGSAPTTQSSSGRSAHDD